MWQLIFVLINSLLLISCATAQVDSKSIDSKDANGIVYKKTFLNQDNAVDSILYVPLLGKITRVNYNLLFPATPVVKGTLDEFIENNLMYQPDFHYQGKILLLLFIDKNGHNSDIRVLAKLPACEKCVVSAMDVIKKIEKWNPALDHLGNPIDCIIPISVRFK